MSPKALNTAVRSAQQLVAFLALSMTQRTPGITQAEIRRRIRVMNPPAGAFWSPGEGTVSTVVKWATPATRATRRT